MSNWLDIAIKIILLVTAIVALVTAILNLIEKFSAKRSKKGIFKK
jgi:hypothetical protein